MTIQPLQRPIPSMAAILWDGFMRAGVKPFCVVRRDPIRVEVYEMREGYIILGLVAEAPTRFEVHDEMPTLPDLTDIADNLKEDTQ